LEILISSLILSLFILIPLGIKWEISLKIILSISILIGAITTFILLGIRALIELQLYQTVIIELFLILGTFLFILLIAFYRDPERIPPVDPNVILSPADGKVIYLKKIEKGAIPYSEKKGKKILLEDFIHENRLFNEGYLIGISMNFLNAHVNRSPIVGKVSLVRYIKGNFFSLKKNDAFAQNERALTIIENDQLKVGIVQIASRLVRKIVLNIKEGQRIGKGERIGMIRFGSQVDLILPKNPPLSILVKEGNQVKAGVTIVARIL
jgi:phosphatidylserine decarboxylase